MSTRHNMTVLATTANFFRLNMSSRKSELIPVKHFSCFGTEKLINLKEKTLDLRVCTLKKINVPTICRLFLADVTIVAIVVVRRACQL